MTKKIRVLRIINRFNLGGPTYNATFLTAFLSDQFETLLVGGMHEENEGSAMFIPEQYGVKPKLLPALQREINFKQDKKALKEIRAIIREFKPDIVHTHASKAGAIGRIAANKEKVPVIVHTFHGHVFHSYFGKFKTAIYKTVERYLAKRSNLIIAISPLQKKELTTIHKIANNKKVEVVNLGFDLERFRINKIENRIDFIEQYNVQEDEVCIGIIGRLTAIKNHQLFFNAIQKVLDKTQKRIHVFVIGDGELMTDLKAMSEPIFESTQARVTFTSWIKDIGLPLSRLDIVCLTSYNEGTPVSLIEAQAVGVPVISTDVGGVRDIVLENKSGLIVDSFDSTVYANALLKLTEDGEHREQLGNNGWDFVKEKFHYKTLCFNIEQLYLNLLNINDDKKKND